MKSAFLLATLFLMIGCDNLPSASSGSTSAKAVWTGDTQDLAINGEGFFVLRSGPAQYYTRYGAFRFQSDRFLLDPHGLRVQGTVTDPLADAPPAPNASDLTDIRIPIGSTMSPRATCYIQWIGNLNGEGNVAAPSRPGERTLTSGRVFDSLGGEYEFTIAIELTARDSSVSTWSYQVDSSDGSVTGSGIVEFDRSGMYVGAEASGTGGPPEMRIDFLSGGMATPQSIEMDFSNITQFADMMGGSSINMSIQDGYTAGVLVNYYVDRSGNVTGISSNGVTSILGRVALARFERPETLRPVAPGLFMETKASGPPLIGAANSPDFGEILAGCIEPLP
jgi:flagellar hook protein FlgE